MEDERIMERFDSLTMIHLLVCLKKTFHGKILIRFCNKVSGLVFIFTQSVLEYLIQPTLINQSSFNQESQYLI